MMRQAVQERIAEEAAALGVRRGGVLLVHSSLRSLGHVPGGAETVVRGLLDAVGPDGTLLMPALSYATVHARQPVFDMRRTPSCVGAITEWFRTRAGAMRSVHPTHSVCGVGPLADAVLGRHHLDETPCGANSPFRAVRDRGGQILFLGCGLRPNTSMHGVEELVEPPYLFGCEVTYRMAMRNGVETRLTCRRHGFDGWAQRYERIGAWMGEPDLKVGKVLEATVHLLDARAFWTCAERALRRDPFCFVERKTDDDGQE